MEKAIRNLIEQQTRGLMGAGLMATMPEEEIQRFIDEAMAEENKVGPIKEITRAVIKKTLVTRKLDRMKKKGNTEGKGQPIPGFILQMIKEIAMEEMDCDADCENCTK